jgi:hypothetical protein
MYRLLNQYVRFFLRMRSLGGEYKQAVYAWSYGNPQPLQTLVDEEGCGAVFNNFVEKDYD